MPVFRAPIVARTDLCPNSGPRVLPQTPPFGPKRCSRSPCAHLLTPWILPDPGPFTPRRRRIDGRPAARRWLRERVIRGGNPGPRIAHTRGTRRAISCAR